MRTIPKLVLTGGPCGGKTTALTFLIQKLSDVGFYPIIVPESATMLMANQITPIGAVFSLETFQRRMLSLALLLEEDFEKAAACVNHPKPVIICDRGLIDAKAYLEHPEDFERLLKELGLDPVHTRDERYDAVFHLRTAALGAEKFYTLDNNPARYETLEQARKRDDEILAAWMGHPHLRVIPNEDSFEQKLKRLFAGCCRALAIPVPLEIERRYSISPDFNPSDLGHSQHVEIEQFYLMNRDPEEVLRLRKRSQHGQSIYFETRKRSTNDPTTRVETERFITAGEYEFGKRFQAPHSRVVRKIRTCFVYEHQYFELDIFQDPVRKDGILEVELTDKNEKVTLPPFIRVHKEVTEDPTYSNHAFAFQT